MLGSGAVPANDSRCTRRDASGSVRVRWGGRRWGSRGAPPPSRVGDSWRLKPQRSVSVPSAPRPPPTPSSERALAASNSPSPREPFLNKGFRGLDGKSDLQRLSLGGTGVPWPTGVLFLALSTHREMARVRRGTQ